MGVNFEVPGVPQSRAQRAAAGSNQSTREREPTEFWMNLGCYVDWVNRRTGEVERRFASIPVGARLENQNLLSTRSDDEDTAEWNAYRNKIIQALFNQAKVMEPGKTAHLKGLEVEMRRVGTEKQITLTEEPPIEFGKAA